jgi:hypothetical protein
VKTRRNIQQHHRLALVELPQPLAGIADFPLKGEIWGLKPVDQLARRMAVVRIVH